MSITLKLVTANARLEAATGRQSQRRRENGCLPLVDKASGHDFSGQNPRHSNVAANQ